MKKITIQIQKTKLRNVFLMENLFELGIGLMFRKKSMALFKLPFCAKHSVYMLFMKFSLDLIFIDKNFKIVDIIENVSPVTLNPKSWKLYIPKKKCKYILEIKSGLAKKLNASIGNPVKF
ncbi:MAG: hypothetical protein B6U87_02730 [Candidatus Aenigmarchaeota archaeon ex4484_52]|nr:MAG: hypothetical protein B6U87_02730 [Candidatus Aenigmarchaeota archaeon ex4484_52]